MTIEAADYSKLVKAMIFTHELLIQRASAVLIDKNAMNRFANG